MCDEIIYVMNISSTKMTNAIAINAASTMSINYCNKEVKHKVNCYVLNTVLLLIILRFIIAIMYYQYGMQRKNLINCIIENSWIFSFALISRKIH